MSYTKTPITVNEAAEILGLSPKTVHNLGGGTARLTRLRLGRSVRLIRQEVEKLRDMQIQHGQKRVSRV
jgi:plasmid maintenance system antidote protein VapI